MILTASAKKKKFKRFVVVIIFFLSYLHANPILRTRKYVKKKTGRSPRDTDAAYV